jgi:hypothetical protein
MAFASSDECDATLDDVHTRARLVAAELLVDEVRK